MSKIISIDKPMSVISENYRGIRTGIEFSNLDKNLKVISITSSKSKEGKTTVTCNLAVSFASLDKKILVIDCDLRNPSIHRTFEISNMFGLTDILIGDRSFAESINITNIKNLHILTSGAIPPNPSEILSSNKIKEFINSLRDIYDYVFIDTPPAGLVTDAEIVSTYSDGTIFVVASNEVDTDLAQFTKEKLDSVDTNILGVVFNKFEYNKNKGYRYGDYYYAKEPKENKKHRIFRLKKKTT